MGKAAKTFLKEKLNIRDLLIVGRAGFTRLRLLYSIVCNDFFCYLSSNYLDSICYYAVLKYPELLSEFFLIIKIFKSVLILFVGVRF